MAKVVTLTQFARHIRDLGPHMESAIIRGLRSAAYRLEGLIVEEIDVAGAVATSELKASVSTELTARGAITGADAPHAPFVNFGTRPHMPPLQPIVDWVMIKGFAADEDEAEDIAEGIRWTIARFGTEPRHFLEKALRTLKQQRIVDEEIRAELGDLERRR